MYSFRTALGIEYEGSSFSGWQALPHNHSVQESVEKALSRIACHAVNTTCSGRTDAGVHATQQIIHFDHQDFRPSRAWLLGANNFVPPGIRILWAQSVSKDFNARFSALSRCYQYHLIQQPTPPGLGFRHLGWDFHSLNLEPMQKAALLLLGRHDFSAFRSVQCQSHQTERELLALEVKQIGPFFTFTIEATGFLHNMVRILVGSLLLIGRGVHSPEWILQVLHSQKRIQAGTTMPPNGLYYCGAHYPDSFNIPSFVFPHIGLRVC